MAEPASARASSSGQNARGTARARPRRGERGLEAAHLQRLADVDVADSEADGEADAGSALGLAEMTVLATSRGADQLGNPVALTNGDSAAFLGAAAIAAVGALLAAVLVRVPKAAAVPDASADDRQPAAA